MLVDTPDVLEGTPRAQPQLDPAARLTPHILRVGTSSPVGLCRDDVLPASLRRILAARGAHQIRPSTL